MAGRKELKEGGAALNRCEGNAPKDSGSVPQDRPGLCVAAAPTVGIGEDCPFPRKLTRQAGAMSTSEDQREREGEVPGKAQAQEATRPTTPPAASEAVTGSF